MDGEDTEHANNAGADIQGFTPYLELPTMAGHLPNANANVNVACVPNISTEPTWLGANAMNNTYFHIIHTNGIHHLAMVTCLCRGADTVSLNLVASQLLPVSFTCIWALFTMMLMDYFHLCNLELKVSAYQFYQLICQLT